jgi:hypothetical protein
MTTACARSQEEEPLGALERARGAAVTGSERAFARVQVAA